MKSLFPVLLVLSLNSLAIATPVEFDAPIGNLIAKRCRWVNSCEVTRTEIAQLLSQLESGVVTRERLVDDARPKAIAKLMTVLNDYETALTNPKIHPKSQELLRNLLTGFSGQQVRESLRKVEASNTEIARLHDLVRHRLGRLDDLVKEFELKEPTIADEELRRIYRTQKFIELRNFAVWAQDAADEVGRFAHAFFKENYSVDHSGNFVPLSEIMDKKCGSIFLNFYLDARRHHEDVLRILVGESGTLPPVRVKCHSGLVGMKPTYSKKGRVLRIPYKKHMSGFFGDPNIELPDPELILKVIQD